jgi:hypothetical protein
MRGRAGAFAQQSKHDTRETTANARAAFLGRFERAVDPDGILEPAERARRADAARKAHMTLLALQSAKKRRLRKRGAA